MIVSPTNLQQTMVIHDWDYRKMVQSAVPIMEKFKPWKVPSDNLTWLLRMVIYSGFTQ
jgi:hypothetical protein